MNVSLEGTGHLQSILTIVSEFLFDTYHAYLPL